jgi:glutamate synthase (NADPH/NADH) small chain
MPDPRGFLTCERRPVPLRPVAERVRDHRHVTLAWPEPVVREQAARCMDCGVPFCHTGCPLGNVIPEWNDLVRVGRWREAAELLDRTNNFPELTGKLCPAPCEPACVLAIGNEPVTIKRIEEEIAERAWDAGWVTPRPPARETGRRAAVIGSGPAGLAAAQELRRAGHAGTIYERRDRAGGLLRYGIPDFKLEKWVLDRRLEQLRAEGVHFETGVAVGDDLPVDELRAGADAIVVACGAERARDVDVTGRELAGVHLAMDYLIGRNRAVAGDPVAPGAITAAGHRVAIIGGGDTAADCLGCAHREGAARVHELAHGVRPPARDPASWPEPGRVLHVYPAHEEGGTRDWLVETAVFTGSDGRVTGLHGHRLGDEPRPFALRVDLVLLAIGFAGAAEDALLDALGVERTAAGTVRGDGDGRTSAHGVFAAGDCVLGADLVVSAIAQGRAAARAAHRHLQASRRPQ